MTVHLGEFLQSLVRTPALFIIVILTLGVILVNGWTDAPNAIATMVSTRSLAVKKSIMLAAVFNFLGVFVMTSINATVAATIANMVDFRGDSHYALIALSAALFAIILWATAAWYFGIPTSESHALIAGVSGAANRLSSINCLTVREMELATEKIINLEDEGDVIYYEAIKNLHIGKVDIFKSYRYSKIYDVFETSVDSFEDLANVVEAIILKNT